ncbi:MAG: outer membrane beta-barrel protein [Cyclobacteriaceae bacterium]|nr:outer membrane beta-barrel protein [Cyclobacteriaceae bacterium]
MKRYLLICLFALAVAPELVSAQSFYAMRRQRSLIFVGGVGTASYLGELANPGDYLDAEPTINLGLQYYINRQISIRADVTWFQLSGSDAKADEASRKKRNLNFYSNNFEMSVVGMYNFYPHGRTFYQRPAFNFYGFAGIGLMYFNPKTDYQGKSYSLHDLKTELVSYSTLTPVIPAGLGVRFKLGPFMNLSFEGGYRLTFTDYLDDVSTIHNDASKFSDPIAAALSDRRGELNPPAPLAADGTQRGNPKANDAYILYNVKLEYYLPGNFFQSNRGPKTIKQNRKAFYRYNKRGGLRK